MVNLYKIPNTEPERQATNTSERASGMPIERVDIVHQLINLFVREESMRLTGELRSDTNQGTIVKYHADNWPARPKVRQLELDVVVVGVSASVHSVPNVSFVQVRGKGLGGRSWLVLKGDDGVKAWAVHEN